MNIIKEFLDKELNYANGCTEPGAIAYSVASASEYAIGKVEKIIIEIDGFIYKNGMATGIPGIKKYRGNKIAAALGYYSKDAQNKKLQILTNNSDAKLKKAEEILDKIDIRIVSENTPYIKTVIYAENKVEAIISDDHSNLKWIKIDDEIFKDFSDNKKNNNIKNNLGETFKKLNFQDIVNLIEKHYDQETETLLLDGLKANQKLIEASKDNLANGIGFKYEEALDGKAGEIAALIAHGIDARMAGVPLPALASSGSGDQGITISIAVYEVGRRMNKSIEEILKATLLAHMVTYYVKLFMGRLSSLCGLISAAATGMLSAFLYFDNKVDKIDLAIKHLIGDSSGIICDGAKSTCAFKAVTGFEQAYKHYRLTISGLNIETPVGIVVDSLEESLKNLNNLSIPSSKTTNQTIIESINN